MKESTQSTDLPKCPKCKSSEHVKRVSCRCLSCPPFCCKNCLPYEGAGYKGYDFYEEDEEETT